jgi:hypothetical protein
MSERVKRFNSDNNHSAIVLRSANPEDALTGTLKLTKATIDLFGLTY